MESKVFVSYSRKDQDEVKCIIDYIEDSLGIKCWIDLKGIETSSEYKDEVMNAIENCEIVLLMVSPNSIASKNVRSEINYADKKRKRIILICLNDSRPDRWILLDFPNVDYIRATNEDQMQKLIHDMEGWLGVLAIGPVLKEISKLYEDWEKLEHEQAGILQHILEKEESIGNRDVSTSERIKSQYIKEETYNKLLQEKELLKRENDELKKQVKEFLVIKEQNLSLINDNRRLIEDNKVLKSQANTSQPSIRSTIGTLLGDLGIRPSDQIAITNGSRHHIFGRYLTFYQLGNFYYCWLPFEYTKEEWMRINKTDFEEKKHCTVDLPTVQELKDILKNGSYKPNFHVYWVKDEGRIRAYRPSKNSFSSDDRAAFVVIVS